MSPDRTFLLFCINLLWNSSRRECWRIFRTRAMVVMLMLQLLTSASQPLECKCLLTSPLGTYIVMPTITIHRPRSIGGCRSLVFGGPTPYILNPSQAKGTLL